MKKLLLAVASLAFMSGAALASSNNGVVMKFSPASRVITLENGHSFTIPRDVGLPNVQVGEKVSIETNDEGDKVTSVLR